MNPYFFAYGSLMTALAHPMGTRLRQEAQFLGPGRVAGRLYRVSWYPGLTEPQTATDLAHGELYKLTDPVKTLAWLDVYEGVVPGRSSAAPVDDYTRVERLAVYVDGTTTLTWVYLYQRVLPPSARIADGIWRG